MKSTFAVIFASVFVVGMMVFLLVNNQSSPTQKRATTNSSSSSSTSLSSTSDSQPTSEGLMLFCAASNRAPVEAICRRYFEEYGQRVDVQYGSSQSLLSSLQVSGTGDLFLPADDSYLTMAREKNLVEEIFPLARMNVVIAVKKGNPKNLQSLDDLLRSDVRLVQADPESAAIGKVVRDRLRTEGKWDAIAQATLAYRPTIADVANDLVVGSADVTFSYDSFLAGYKDLEPVPLELFKTSSSLVAMGVAASSKNPQAAIHFARFASAQDRGLEEYAKLGFDIVEGDKWSEQPELILFAGSMLRPAIEETIIKFEQREGVKVTRVYNGCGILVAQMQAGQTPDAYFACDKEFMRMVPDLFPESVDVSQNELIILVQKGNPKGISSLRDLSKEGLKVGIGHEKQCAMGWLTQNTLKEDGIQQEVMSNVTVQTQTGDLLVNQMLTGALDAAVVYLSNAAGAGEKLDAVRITGLECAVATQPFAVRQGSQNTQTAARLFAAINRPESQEIFAAEGFGWMLPQSQPKMSAAESAK